jgi:DNA adenine methylase
MTAASTLIREIAIKDRRTGAIGVRKVYSDRSHVDVMPMATIAKKSGTRENKSMNYPGGKGAEGVFQTIINQMPKHRVYIEPFLGGGAILRKKRPADTTWACEFEPDAFKRFQPGDDSGFHATTRLVDVFSNSDKRQWNDARGLPSLFLIHQDGLKFLRDFLFQGDQANTMIYCDPPYLMDTRSSKSKIYAEEFHTRDKHTELLSFLMSLTYGSKANIMISGYDHPLYNEMLSDWRKISFQGISRGGPRTEVIWMNYPEPVELHDYRYLGADYREREQIARQTRRWIAKLEAMPVQRRLALISSIEDHFASADNVTNGDAAALPVGVIAEPSGAIAQSETPATIDVESDEPREIIVDAKRLCDDGDIARSLSVQQIANGKVAKPFQFNQKWYVGTGACGGGSKVKGWEYVDAYEIVAIANYSGETYTYGQHISLPDDHPDRFSYNGLLVNWNRSMHVLVGPELKFRQDLTAKKNGVKSKPQHDHSPSKKAMPAIAA